MEWMRKTKTNKNINYQLPTTVPSPTPPSDEETSLRVLSIDGEFDSIFQSLDHSGPEDISIPTHDWEALKFRSVDVVSVSVRNGEKSVLLRLCLGVWRTLGGGKYRGKWRNLWGKGEEYSFTTSHIYSDSDVSREEYSFTTSHIYSHSDVSGESNLFPYRMFKPVISPWQKGIVLGKGSFGPVYECVNEDGFFFAAKEVSLLDDGGSQGEQSISQLEQEISLLSQFQHDNIVQYHGSDKNESTLFIFLELATKGSLASLYQSYQLNDSQVVAYTRQILNGLKYLHERNVVHRNIKCANILVDVNNSVKLADFGLAKATRINDPSLYWMAPEVVNLGNQGYGLAADIWSLGCTVLEMLTWQPPYFDLDGMHAVFRIGRGEPPLVPESLSTDARDFILKCLHVNPSKRPTAAQLSDHPFLRRP